ncbi:MAG: hypothetical protein ACXV39_10755 [Halobacteriota archaeon]
MFYFSGVSGKAEASILINNGVKHFLLDYIDFHKLKDTLPADAEIIIDSAAYKVFKGSLQEINIDALMETAKDKRVKWVVAPDVIGDEQATLENWNRVKHRKDVPWLPVWGSYSSEDLLESYLAEFEHVGIGALVDRLRMGYAGEFKDNKEAKKEAEQFLKYLTGLCQKYLNRFHLFGVCWTLEPLCYSMDSSKWITTAKKRKEILFKHATSGDIRNAPVSIARRFKEFANDDLSDVDTRLKITIAALDSFNCQADELTKDANQGDGHEDRPFFMG